jgi:hypothetical protein
MCPVWEGRTWELGTLKNGDDLDMDGYGYDKKFDGRIWI